MRFQKQVSNHSELRTPESLQKVLAKRNINLIRDLTH